MFPTLKLCPRHRQLVLLRSLTDTARSLNSQKSSSKGVRASFIDYFVKEHDHKFVKSSSVLPHNDPTLVTVNAGMNQFKDILLNKTTAQDPFHDLKRAVNSQKCIRCGGKHNDLTSVGHDFRHQTFFEMLGNWSFGDYYKTEAIKWSWQLLTEVYKLDPKRLFVTYFAGDPRLGVDADGESREIWSSLGLSPERIIPLGTSENFWEMAKTGPCGPCSEIHYLLEPVDLKSVDQNALFEQHSLEIWNLVFMQYNRMSESELKPLPRKHVDTGMGLERIVSVLQGTSHSNYDTDLFIPLFEAIQSHVKCKPYSGSLSDPLDIAYRIIADHSRMYTVAISDGIEPDGRGAGHKVRKVIRAAYWQLKYTMNHHQVKPVLRHLPAVVAESLSCAYPELEQKLPEVREVVGAEVDLFKIQIQRSKNEFKLKAKEIQSRGDKQMSLKEAVSFVSSFGAPIELLKMFADRYQVTVNWPELEKELD